MPRILLINRSGLGMGYMLEEVAKSKEVAKSAIQILLVDRSGGDGEGEGGGRCEWRWEVEMSGVEVGWMSAWR